jgi:hypothetical protein
MSSGPITHNRVPASLCPACSAVLDAASGDGIVRPGDLSVCFTCGEILVFDRDLKIAAADMSVLAQDPELRASDYRKLLIIQREIRVESDARTRSRGR